MIYLFLPCKIPHIYELDESGYNAASNHESQCVETGTRGGLKLLNHVSRTLPRFPYTNLKKSRTEKNWLLSMRSRDSLQCSAVNIEK